jgi:hypothetical protein
MTRSNPKYRRPLTEDQLEILELLYKFRFGSSSLVAAYFGKSHRMFAFNRLKILEEQGFTSKRFDNSYRLQAKPAAYYLSPAGARKLQERREPNEKDEINLKATYKDKTVSENFISHSLNIFSIYNHLKAFYKDKLDFFTKRDLATYENFPDPLPDAFLSLEAKDSTKHFFLEAFEESERYYLFSAIKKIKQYLAFRESGEWAVTDTDFPIILFVCDSVAMQEQIQKQITKTLNKSLIDDLVFATTTKEELKELAQNDKVWQLATAPDTKLPLPSI